MSNYYTKTETDNKLTNVKNECGSIFGSIDKVGDIGTINDGTYNKPWVIYTISGSTYQLFPRKNLTDHSMNPTNTNAGGYTGSEMYTFVHNTVLPNLRRSGLNITSCDLISLSVYKDIISKTGIEGKYFVDERYTFWLTNTYGSVFDRAYFSYGEIHTVNWGDVTQNDSTYSLGVRPLITVVM